MPWGASQGTQGVWGYNNFPILPLAAGSHNQQVPPAGSETGQMTLNGMMTPSSIGMGDNMSMCSLNGLDQAAMCMGMPGMKGMPKERRQLNVRSLVGSRRNSVTGASNAGGVTPAPGGVTPGITPGAGMDDDAKSGITEISVARGISGISGMMFPVLEFRHTT